MKLRRYKAPVQDKVDLSAKADKAEVSAIDTALKSTDKTIFDRLSLLDANLASSIAEWSSSRAYKANNIVIRNKAFFAALQDNLNKDPLVDASGNWAIFNPNSASDIFANRSPTNNDVQPVGTKWHDVSFGSTTPLSFISLGNNGAWQYLNQITLSRIRLYGNGLQTTYRSTFYGIKFYRADGSLIPNSWFVWGNGSGLSKPNAGTAYTGQSVGAGGNSSGWIELEPSSSFDLSVAISRVAATLYYMKLSAIEFYYSNGGKKSYSFDVQISAGTPATEVTVVSPDPPLPCRYGDAIASVLGEVLTATKLTNSTNTDPGRLTGEAYTSAWHTLFQAEPQIQEIALKANKTDLDAYTKTSDLWKTLPTFDWVNSQLDDINGFLNQIPLRFALKSDIPDVPALPDLSPYALKSELPGGVDLAPLNTRIDGIDQTLISTIQGFNALFFEHQERINAKASSTDLANETSSRHNADTLLGNRISNAEQTIADLAGTIDDDLTEETSARTSADTTLTNSLTGLSDRISAIETALTEPKSVFVLVNAGTWTTFKTLQWSIPGSGNRSVMIRSVSGTISARWINFIAWDNTITLQTATITPTSNQYLWSAWHFGGAGNNQHAIIEDTTNKKRYRLTMLVGSSYLNNVFSITDIT